MRLCKLILWDIRFQIKYGFYFLYFVLTIAYIFILSVLPDTIENAYHPPFFPAGSARNI